MAESTIIIDRVVIDCAKEMIAETCGTPNIVTREISIGSHEYESIERFKVRRLRLGECQETHKKSFDSAAPAQSS